VGNRKPELQHNSHKLAFEQFSELNALLYRTNPSQYFRTRLHGVAVHLKPEAEAVSLPSGATLWLPPQDEDTRLRYAAMETTVLLHHAAETLIRAYLAHRQQPDCPWLEIAKLNNYRKFKETTRRMIAGSPTVWDRRELAQVFFGGTDPVNAAVDIDVFAWDEHLNAMEELIIYSAQRFLDDAPLYNSAKHGLSSIANEGLAMAIQLGRHPGAELMDGPALAYLRTLAKPENPPSEHFEWNFTVTSVVLEADLRTVEVICKALEAIWAVALRNYTGTAARTWVFSSAYVQASLHKGRAHTPDVANTADHRLVTTRRDVATGRRRISGTAIHVRGTRYRPEFLRQVQLYDLDANPPTPLDLPVRDQDRRVSSTSGNHFFPFSPPGSNTDPDPATIIGDASP
jgi:hypothetical protein